MLQYLIMDINNLSIDQNWFYQVHVKGYVVPYKYQKLKIIYKYVPKVCKTKRNR